MSDMKCPLCMQKMNKSQNNMFYCATDNCSLRYIDMPKKALEEFAESYQNRLTDCKRIGNLNEGLICTRKALGKAKQDLEIARKAMNQVMSMGAKNNICYQLKAKTVKSILGNALEQIEHKEKQNG